MVGFEDEDEDERVNGKWQRRFAAERTEPRRLCHYAKRSHEGLLDVVTSQERGFSNPRRVGDRNVPAPFVTTTFFTNSKL